ncbi:nicolin-1-like [Penaeus chinensis]|uniref:nicolin-1-like n=1 Tax=Penaeus chinensis TaxID=139456 RepID=UPI001FB70BDB|nr:nicolin-1-like [Penaeus chinensis]XP_047470203.1 nicolin-1-like [Penaeus chinensis]
MSRETVSFNQSGPTPVCADEGSLTSRTGCYVITLTFSQPTQIGEITFRNYYTWGVGVHVLRAATSSPSNMGGIVGAGLLGNDAGSEAAWTWKDPSAWQVGVKNKVIMPHPHTETASHDFVSVTCLESRVDWQDVIGMRLILRQPSPVWRTFFIEEITAYRELPRLLPFSVPIINQDGQGEKPQPTPLDRLIQQTRRAMRVPDEDSLEGGLTGGGYELVALQYT